MRNPPDVPGVRSQRTRFQKLLAYLKRYWFLYLLVLPGFVFMIVFNYGPMYGIQLAFKDYHANLGIWGSPWVGLEHFRESCCRDDRRRQFLARGKKHADHQRL